MTRHHQNILRLTNACDRKAWMFACILICSSCVCVAQGVREDFARVNATYRSCRNLSAEVEYRFYANDTAVSPVETQYGSVKKLGGDLYFKLADVERISTGKFWMLINHRLQSIFVDRPKQEKSRNVIDMNVDSVLAHCSTVTSSDPSPNKKSYILNFNRIGYRAVEIVFNRTTYFIEKIVIHYRNAVKVRDNVIEQPPRMEILYSKIDTSEANGKELLSGEQYVHTVGGKLQLQPKYSSYKFTNYVDSR